MTLKNFEKEPVYESKTVTNSGSTCLYRYINQKQIIMFHFRATFFFLIFSVFYCSISAQEVDKYYLNFDTEKEVVGVTAQISLADSILYMSEYSSKSDYFPKYVSDLQVTDVEGKQIKTQFRDSVRWIFHGVKPGERINLKYDLHLDHEEREWPGGIDGVAYTRDYGIMTSGRALFVMNGERKENIQVRVEVPQGAKVSTPWKEIPSEHNSFLVANQENLQESFLFAGTHEEILINRGSFTLKFILGGKTLMHQEQKIISTANQLLDYYVELMGGIPEPAPGMNLDQCMVIVTENDKIDGEVIGNHISMFMNPDGDPQTQMIGWFIFAHEFFHLWNGKSIQFEGTTSDWFKEGVSNYYTLKGLNQVGFINEEAYKTILNNLFYERYINDPGLGSKSPVNSADGFSKDNHWGLIYGGGLFAGIASDMEIRQHSSNEKSLDDLMRYFYDKYAGTNDSVNNEILKDKIEEFGFAGFTEFFESYLSGNQVISLDSYLEYAGAEVSIENKNLIIQSKEERSKLQKEIWEGFLGRLD